MSLKKYLSEIESVVSETGLYTPLASHVFGALLGYPPKHRIINKSGKEGTPDVRLYSQEDGSQWGVVEVKFDDSEIRDEDKRKRVWKDQVLERGYIEPETFYVVLCAPRTFYVCDLGGSILEGIHILNDGLFDPATGSKFPLTDQSFRHRLNIISYAASLERRQYEAFRLGKLKTGYIPLTPNTLPQLQAVFSDAITKLKEYCRVHFLQLRAESELAKKKIEVIERELSNIGSGAVRRREKLLYQRRTIRARHRLALELFEDDYERFRHDQTYAGTQEEENFEDIFCTNTAYVALSRLIFVRICEDVGLTTRKISNSGIATWRNFVRNIKEHYQDLLELAFEDVKHVYSSLFETSVFDWFGKENGRLHELLERILFRLNAFSFKEINRDVLGSIYQYFRPRVERRRLGEYYTPVEVVDYIIERTGMASDPDIMQKRILDPACGSFTFGVRAMTPLLRAGARLTSENKIDLIRRCIVGRDINPFSVFLSHLSLLFGLIEIYLDAKKRDVNYVIAPMDIQARNSLTFGIPSAREITLAEGTESDEETIEQLEQFDYVVGNPPFVRNERLPPEDREVLNDLYGDLAVRNTDLSVFFLYVSAKYFAKQRAKLGMVAPVAIANTQMAAYLRNTLRDSEITELVSLEWCAKELFPGADIIPMLIFLTRSKPCANHAIRLVSGIENPQELKKCLDDPEFFSKKSSIMPFKEWSNLSPLRDWCLDVTNEDVPILRHLNSRRTLGDVSHCPFAIKAGTDSKFLRAAKGSSKKDSEVYFLKGQHVAMFHASLEVEEFAELSRIRTADDASIWEDLDFYIANRGKADSTGLGRFDYKTPRRLATGCPSDTLCCLIPEISVTLAASVVDPLEVAANNSVIAVVPKRYSAYCLSAVINSRISRYYAFLTLRSAILLRRRTTWFPRAIKALRMPELSTKTAKRLHDLAFEATNLSHSVKGSELEAYLSHIEDIKHFQKAGFLGIQVSGLEKPIDREDLADLKVFGTDVMIGRARLKAKSADLLTLVRVALLASEKEEFTPHDIENILLPSDVDSQVQLASRIRSFATDMQSIQSRVLTLLEEIDEIVASGLGISPAQHETVRRRCREFPLEVTVERPRFAWSAGRKKQARRTYRAGERFK